MKLISRGGFWFATDPAYPGLMTDAKTKELAKKRFNRALKVWVQIARADGWTLKGGK